MKSRRGYTPNLHRFPIPLLKRHWSLGKISEVPERNKKMEPHEVALFLAALKSHSKAVFYDLALTQFYIAGRIQEAAGLIKECIDFQERSIMIKNVIVWSRSTKQFEYLKRIPKNKKVRYCHITDTLLNSLRRRIAQSTSKYVFEVDGKPLSYSQIKKQYDKALKKAGLDHKYGGTYIMRHSTASITRKITGSADHTQAMTGHQDVRQVEHYAGTPDDKQIDAVIQLDKYMKKVVVKDQKRKKISGA